MSVAIRFDQAEDTTAATMPALLPPAPPGDPQRRLHLSDAAVEDLRRPSYIAADGLPTPPPGHPTEAYVAIGRSMRAERGEGLRGDGGRVVVQSALGQLQERRPVRGPPDCVVRTTLPQAPCAPHSPATPVRAHAASPRVAEMVRPLPMEELCVDPQMFLESRSEAALWVRERAATRLAEQEWRPTLPARATAIPPPHVWYRL